MVHNSLVFLRVVAVSGSPHQQAFIHYLLLVLEQQTQQLVLHQQIQQFLLQELLLHISSMVMVLVLLVSVQLQELQYNLQHHHHQLQVIYGITQHLQDYLFTLMMAIVLNGLMLHHLIFREVVLQQYQ
jgi:uncharacterized membrane protein